MTVGMSRETYQALQASVKINEAIHQAMHDAWELGYRTGFQTGSKFEDGGIESVTPLPVNPWSVKQ